MNHIKPALGLKVAAIALLGLGTAVAVPASAYAGTGPGGRCNANWTTFYTELGYTAQCAYASGAPGSTSPFNFRVRVTCIRTGHPDVTVTGPYSAWKASATCARGYDPTAARVEWREA